VGIPFYPVGVAGINQGLPEGYIFSLATDTVRETESTHKQIFHQVVMVDGKHHQFVYKK
jgi:F0F1-type ATP synthase membrane subunit c/vacuolar-type H+-ATPase subunit K